MTHISQCRVYFPFVFSTNGPAVGRRLKETGRTKLNWNLCQDTRRPLRNHFRPHSKKWDYPRIGLSELVRDFVRKWLTRRDAWMDSDVPSLLTTDYWLIARQSTLEFRASVGSCIMHRAHSAPVCCSLQSLDWHTHVVIYSGAVLTYRGRDDRSII